MPNFPSNSADDIRMRRFNAALVALLFAGSAMVLSSLSVVEATAQRATGVDVVRPQSVVAEFAESVSAADIAATAWSYEGPTFGVLRPVGSDLDAYADAGIDRVTLELGWDLFEPVQGHLDGSYVAEAIAELETYSSRDIDVVLDIGLQYPPPWVFDLPGETRFVDQYGTRWKGAHGLDVPNAVFNGAVRSAQGSFITRAVDALGPANFVGVRVGGLLQNEVRYPGRSASGRSDSFWAFDDAARSISPTPNWRPGSDPAANSAFLDFYFGSLTDYTRWLVDQYRVGFPGEIQVLLPGWGLRPGDIDTALSSGVNGQSSPEINDLISMGVAFEDIANTLSGIPRVVLYTTYIDALNQGSSDQLTSPAEYLSKLAGRYGHSVGGENSGDNSTNSALTRIDELVSAGVVDNVMWLAGERFYWPGQVSLSDYSSVVHKYANSPCSPVSSCVRDNAVGLVDVATGLWRLTDHRGTETSFYFGSPGDYPFTGDWDCDGVDTPGLYRQSDGFVYLRNSNTQGVASIRFFLGNPGDVPLAGDFDGDGCDTISIYRPSEARVFVVNRLGSDDGGLGAADIDFHFGNVGDKPITGDFNNNGSDSVGLHRESTGFIYYRDSLTTGIADNDFFFGDPGDQIITGRWEQNPNIGPDTVGIFRASQGHFYLSFSNSQGAADVDFKYGNSGVVAIAGDFGS